MCSDEISRKRISVVEAQQLVVLLRYLKLMQAEISTCEENGGREKCHAENETDGIALSPTKLYPTLQGAVERGGCTFTFGLITSPGGGCSLTLVTSGQTALWLPWP